MALSNVYSVERSDDGVSWTVVGVYTIKLWAMNSAETYINSDVYPHVCVRRFRLDTIKPGTVLLKHERGVGSTVGQRITGQSSTGTATGAVTTPV